MWETLSGILGFPSSGEEMETVDVTNDGTGNGNTYKWGNPDLSQSGAVTTDGIPNTISGFFTRLNNNITSLFGQVATAIKILLFVVVLYLVYKIISAFSSK